MGKWPPGFFERRFRGSGSRIFFLELPEVSRRFRLLLYKLEALERGSWRGERMPCGPIIGEDGSPEKDRELTRASRDCLPRPRGDIRDTVRLGPVSLPESSCERGLDSIVEGPGRTLGFQDAEVLIVELRR